MKFTILLLQLLATSVCLSSCTKVDHALKTHLGDRSTTQEDGCPGLAQGPDECFLTGCPEASQVCLPLLGDPHQRRCSAPSDNNNNNRWTGGCYGSLCTPCQDCCPPGGTGSYARPGACFDPSTERCSCNGVSSISSSSKNNKGPDCCPAGRGGPGGWYDNATRTCCSGNFCEKSASDLCCGSSCLNPMQHSCCNGTPCPFPDAGCCGPTNQVCFNTKEQTCSCGGTPTPIASSCCAGVQAYDPQAETCCNVTVIASNATSACCNNDTQYNPETQTCCGPAGPISLNVSSQCCGGVQAYDPQANTCCNGTVMANSSTSACCNDVQYNPQTSSCCGNQTLCVSGQQKCCVYESGGFCVNADQTCNPPAPPSTDDDDDD